MTVPAPENRNERAFPWRYALLLAAVFLTGLFLRLYRITAESAWYDEVITLGFLNAPDLPHFFEAWRYTNWNAVPVYYTLEYFWGNYISSSVLSLRLLSILFGMAAIPLIYDFGRRLYGHLAGLTAALLLALSSVHIYQAQEIRNYSLTMLTALFCAHTFYLLADRPSPRRFFLHILAVQLLIWTHLFGCYLLVALGVFLILFRWRQWRLTLPWFAVNGLLMTPVLFWIRGFEPIQYYAPPPPRAWMMVNNAFTDVFSPTLAISIFRGPAWQITPDAWTDFFERTYHAADNLSLAVMLLLIGWLAFRVWRGRKNTPAEETQKTPVPSREKFALLFIWLALPGILLYALAHLWRTDVFSPKYTVYSSLAGYLLIGGAVQHAARMKYIALLILVALFAHRYGAVTTHPQRPDWNRAAAWITAESTPEDGYIIYPGWLGVVAEYHLEKKPPAIARTGALGAACLESEKHFEAGRPVWMIFAVGYGNAGIVDRYGVYLERRGIPYTQRNFWSGMRCIFVIRAESPENFKPLPPGRLEALTEAVSVSWTAKNDGTDAGQPVPEH
jgi:mannosyltransferase